jgi:beta-glucosidase
MGNDPLQPDDALARLRTPGQPLLYGSATAAQQIEGGASVDGRGDSIWDVFSRVPGAVAGGDTPERACEGYTRYRDDVALMAELGLDVYRFSVSWARVRPDGGSVNHKGLDYYSRLVDALLERGILPWLTLYHWDLPQILEDRGGWAVRETAQRFVEYAESVHDALGDRVRVWTTLNEPWCSAFLGYTGGEHAPGRQSPADGIRAAHHLLLAHGMTTNLLRERDPEATLGLTLNFTPALPADPTDPADVDAARRLDAQANRVFLDPIFRGSYPQDLLADLETAGLGMVLDGVVADGDLAIISTPIDVLGVNYYTDAMVTGHGEAGPVTSPGARPLRSPFPVPNGIVNVARDVPRTAQGWEIHPDGLTTLLERLQEEYTGPAGTFMAMTENGAAYDDVVGPDGEIDDADRLHYLRSHIEAMLAARKAGADVRAYLAWSLLDNFEWAHGYARRFGIVHVDFDDQTRRVKSSGRWFGQVARGEVLLES